MNAMKYIYDENNRLEAYMLSKDEFSGLEKMERDNVRLKNKLDLYSKGKQQFDLVYSFPRLLKYNAALQEAEDEERYVQEVSGMREPFNRIFGHLQPLMGVVSCDLFRQNEALALNTLDILQADLVRYFPEGRLPGASAPKDCKPWTKGMNETEMMHLLAVLINELMDFYKKIPSTEEEQKWLRESIDCMGEVDMDACLNTAQQMIARMEGRDAHYPSLHDVQSMRRKRMVLEKADRAYRDALAKVIDPVKKLVSLADDPVPYRFCSLICEIRDLLRVPREDGASVCLLDYSPNLKTEHRKEFGEGDLAYPGVYLCEWVNQEPRLSCIYGGCRRAEPNE